MTFDKKYWDDNYSEPDTMDGIANAKEHANYLKSFLNMESVKIYSIADFGFGMGVLLNTIANTLKPRSITGIEPSSYIFKKFDKSQLHPKFHDNLDLQNINLYDWCINNQDDETVYDLGILTSVFQYIDDTQLKTILPIISKKVRYLYLTVPTDIELDWQINHIEFHDKYAIRRTRPEYWKLLKNDFTCISSRILESKAHFNEQTTKFTDLLFRF